MRLDSTRTSARWSERPGNFDKLNLRRIFPSSNQWGIPDLPATDLPGQLARLVGWNDRHAVDHPKPGDAIHFFLDDYRFETMWTWPERCVSRLQRVGVTLTPDFSMWRDMPMAAQLWQVYRARWCGAWAASHGVQVIPTVSWSTPDSYELAFLGISTGSTVAVSTVGIHRDPGAQTLFDQGFREMINRLNPNTVLIYGAPLPCLETYDNLVYYPTRWR